MMQAKLILQNLIYEHEQKARLRARHKDMVYGMVALWGRNTLWMRPQSIAGYAHHDITSIS